MKTIKQLLSERKATRGFMIDRKKSAATAAAIAYRTIMNRRRFWGGV